MSRVTEFDTNKVQGVETDFKPGLSTVTLAEREDGSSIAKTLSLNPSRKLWNPPFSKTSLQGRVSAGEPGKHPLLEEMRQIEPEHLNAIDKILSQNDSIEPNYLIKIQNLVGQILVQLNKIAEKDRTQIEDLKLKYKNAIKDSADKLRELGSHGFKFSMIAMAGVCCQFLSPYQEDRDILAYFAKEGIRGIGDVFGNQIQSDMKKVEGLSSLLYAEYQAKTQKGQSDAGSKQEVIALLDKVLESLKRAAQA